MSLKFDKSKKEEKDLVLEENVPIMVQETTYVYFMTNDWTKVVEKVKKLGCRTPTEKDFTETLKLHRNVKNKMAQIKASWSITATKEYEVLNYYNAETDKAFFAVLNQLRPEKKPLAKMLDIICAEDNEAIINFAKQGFDIEQRFEYGLSLTMWAAIHNKYESLKTLIEVGADINVYDSEGVTPLMYAVSYNALESIKVLLHDKNIDINASDANGQTALMTAAHCGYTDSVKLLIDAGANVNASSLLGETALHQSILNKKDDVSIILMDAKADINKTDTKNNTPFLDAIKVDDVFIEKELIKRGVKLSNNGKENYVEVAAFNNSKQSFNFFIEKNLISDKEIQLGIALAIAFKHIDCATSLIRRSADQHKSALTAFCFSCATNQKIVIDNLINDLSFINEFSSFDMTPLMCACYDNSEDTARMLIERGADINLANKDGKTALMCAAERENIKVIRLLIQNGANKSSKDKDGNTYEYYALNLDKKSFVDILFEKLTQKQIEIKDEHKDIIPKERKSFTDRLYWHIQKYLEQHPDKKESHIYKPARISKQTFSHMKNSCKKNYRPEKINVLRLASGLELSQKETEDLLQSAGYYFDENDVIDTVVKNSLSMRNWSLKRWDIEISIKMGKEVFVFTKEK